ncbi:MAG: HAMP domain-containing histidine kinase [Pseudomonadales bacterium]|jgi:C4-dicarboxylate-specific signal transduction histidine kinase|nr:HAMP domain-containing histidine kinase [Pseudomonadales bacterium]
MSEDVKIKELKHALASPLTNIIYSLELLTMEGGKIDLLKSDELKSVLHSVDQLRALVGGRETTMIGRETFCVVDEIKQLAKAYHKPYNVQIIISVPNESIHLCGKKETFISIMHALMDNAVEAYPKNQGDRKIHISLAMLSGRIAIFINDSGCGISQPANLFFKMRYFSTKEYKSGLGLSSVIDNLAKEFKGKLSHETKKNIGTTMIVEIPMMSR